MDQRSQPNENSGPTTICTIAISIGIVIVSVIVIVFNAPQVLDCLQMQRAHRVFLIHVRSKSNFSALEAEYVEFCSSGNYMTLPQERDRLGQGLRKQLRDRKPDPALEAAWKAYEGGIADDSKAQRMARPEWEAQQAALERGSLHRDVKMSQFSKQSDTDLGFVMAGGFLHYDYDVNAATGDCLQTTSVSRTTSVLPDHVLI
jgi:hypothetical protein